MPAETENGNPDRPFSWGGNMLFITPEGMIHEWQAGLRKYKGEGLRE